MEIELKVRSNGIDLELSDLSFSLECKDFSMGLQLTSEEVKNILYSRHERLFESVKNSKVNEL